MAVASGVAFVAAPRAACARELAYVAPDGSPDACPSRDEVAGRIEAATPTGRPAKIEIRRRAPGFHGVVTLGGGDDRLTRAVDARTCAAVVDALALVVALDVPAEAPMSNEEAEENAKQEAEPTSDAASPAKAPDDAPPKSVDPDRVTPGSLRPTKPIDVSLGISFSSTGFASGERLDGATLYGDVAARRDVLGLPWLRPSARLGIEQTLTTVTGRAGGFASRFQLSSGVLDLCPLGGDFGSRVSIAVCGRSELGALKASAGAPGADFGITRLWATAGGVARVRFVSGTAGSLRWALEAGGGATSPLVRDRFWDYDALVTEIPHVLWTASVGAAVILP